MALTSCFIEKGTGDEQLIIDALKSQLRKAETTDDFLQQLYYIRQENNIDPEHLYLLVVDSVMSLVRQRVGIKAFMEHATGLNAQVISDLLEARIEQYNKDYQSNLEKGILDTEEETQRQEEINTFFLDQAYGDAADAKDLAQAQGIADMVNIFFFNRDVLPEEGVIKKGYIKPENRYLYIRKYQQMLFDKIIDAFSDDIPQMLNYKGISIYKNDTLTRVLDSFINTFGQEINDRYRPNLLDWHRNRKVNPKFKQKLDAYRAFTILTNFDSMASLAFGKSLHITPNMNSVTPTKYVFDTSNKVVTFRTNEDIDLSREVDAALQSILNSTPYFEYGAQTHDGERYLKFTEFASVLTQIKDLASNEETRNFVLFEKNAGSGLDTHVIDVFDNVGLETNIGAHSLHQETIEFIEKILPDYLERDVITLSDLLTSMRFDSVRGLQAIIDVMTQPVFWESTYSGDEASKWATTPFKNILWTAYKGITELGHDSISINQLCNFDDSEINLFKRNRAELNTDQQLQWDAAHAKYSDLKSGDNYFSFVAQVADSAYKAHFLQYYKNEDGNFDVRELYNKLVNDLKNKLGYSINSANRLSHFKALEDLQSRYVITFKDNEALKPLRDTDKYLDATIVIPNVGELTVLNTGVIEEGWLNPKKFNKDAALKFINDVLSINLSGAYYDNFVNLMSGSNHELKETNALRSLVEFAVRVYTQRSIVDRFADDYKNGKAEANFKFYDKMLAKPSKDTVETQRQAAFSTQEFSPKISVRLGVLDFIVNNSDKRSLFNLASAKAITEGLSVSSQTKDGEGNGLGLNTLSRVIGSLMSQVNNQGLMESSAVKDLSLFRVPGLYKGVYKMQEAYINGVSTKHTDFNISEFGTASFLLDFVEGFVENTSLSAVIGNNTIGLLPSVNSDKTFIGRLLINLGITCPEYNKSYKDLSDSELDDLISKDLGGAYKAVKSHINQDFNLLYNSGFLPVQLGYSEYEINRAIIELNNLYKGSAPKIPQLLKEACKKYNLNRDTNAVNLLVRTLKTSSEELDKVPLDKKTELLNALNRITDLNAFSINPKGDSEVYSILFKHVSSKYGHEFLKKHHYKPTVALYENLHMNVDKNGELILNSTLVNLIDRFEHRDKLKEFWNIKNYEMVKSALNNGFDLYIQESSQDGVMQKAMSYIRQYFEKDPSWIDQSDNHFIFAKVELKNGEIINLANKVDVKELEAKLNYGKDLMSNFTSLKHHPEVKLLIINPLMQKWNKMDYLFTQEYMLSSVGSHIAHPNKTDDGNLTHLAQNDPERELAYEASRFFALHKRNVAMTAAKHEFQLNYLKGIPSVYNISVIKDVKDSLCNAAGIKDEAKPYDGATYVNPLIVLLENNSLGAERAGINKKQFGHFFDACMAGAGIIKTAGFGITNSTLRNSVMADRQMFKEMTDKPWLRKVIFDGSSLYSRDCLYELYIYNLLKDYDGETIDYKDLYYEKQIMLEVPKDGKYKFYTKSDGSYELVEDPNGTALKQGPKIQKFIYKRSFKDALFIEETGYYKKDAFGKYAPVNKEEPGATFLLRGQYIFNDVRCDYETDFNQHYTLKASKTNQVLEVRTSVVNTNYKAYTELFKGYLTVEDMRDNLTDMGALEKTMAKAFEYTPLELVDGKLVQSEASMAYLAQAACLVGDKYDQTKVARTGLDVYQPMKHSDIHYFVTAGAIKLMAANVNSAESYYNGKDVDFYEIEATELGIQLDKEHHADTEELSLMNQVVSALAARGYSLDDAEAAYKAIAALTDLGLQKYIKDFKGYLNNDTVATENFLKSVRRTVCMDLLKTTQRDGAFFKNLASQVLEALKELGKLMGIVIPFSDAKLYRKISSMLTTNFTSDAIKNKISGVLAVLCPSHDRVRIYDNKLLGHLKMDLLIRANRIAHQPENAFFLRTNTGMSSTNFYKIRLNRTYDVTYIDANGNTQIKAITPKTNTDYRELKNAIYNQLSSSLFGGGTVVSIYENVLAGRNLGHYDVHFEGSYTTAANEQMTEHFNINDLDSVVALDKVSNFKKAASKLDGSIDKLNALIKNINDFIKEIKGKAYSGDIDFSKTLNTIDNTSKITNSVEDVNNYLKHLETMLRRSLQYDLFVLTPHKEGLDLEAQQFSQQDQANLNAVFLELIQRRNKALKQDDEESDIRWLEILEFLKIDPKKPISKEVVKYKLEKLLESNDEVTRDYALSYINETKNTFNIISEFNKYAKAFLEQSWEELPDDIKTLFANNKLGKAVLHVNINNLEDTLHRAQMAMRKYNVGTVFVNGQEVVVNRKNIEVIPYEVVMSKVNKTLLSLADDDCVETLRKNPSLFLKRILKRLERTISNNKYYDIEFKCLDGRHIYLLDKSNAKDLKGSDFKKITPFLKTEKEDKNGNPIWKRYSSDNKLIYKMFSKDDEIWLDSSGNEIIITSNSVVDGTKTSDAFDFYRENLSKYTTLDFSTKESLSKDKNNISMIRSFISGCKTSKNDAAKNWFKYLHNLSKEESIEFNKRKAAGEKVSLWDHIKERNAFIADKLRFNTLDLKGTPLSYIKGVADKLYASFLITLEQVAARIPAQSLQSFMPMTIVDFCDEDINTAYVSTMQIWLLGSDYDIDAVSLASYSLLQNGEFAGWSPYFDNRSIEGIRESFYIPFPTGNTVLTSNWSTNLEDVWKELKEANTTDKEITRDVATAKAMKRLLAKDLFVLEVANFHKTITEHPEFLTKDGDLKVRAGNGTIPLLRNLLLHFELNETFDVNNAVKEHLLTPEQASSWKIATAIANKHNTYLSNEDVDGDRTIAYSKNMLVRSMIKVTSDPKNLLQSQTPIDPITKPFKALSEQTDGYKDLITFTPGNVWNKIQAIYINQVGKDGIAICATGLKAFLAATHFSMRAVNSNDSEKMKRLFVNPSNLYLWGDKVDKTLGASAKTGRLVANLMAKDPTQITSAEFRETLASIDNDADATLVLSALMSLATDNAKELCLGNLNAGTKMMPLYIYGITLGFDFKELNRLITSPLGWTIAELFDGNFMTGKDGCYSFDLVFSYLIEGPKRLMKTAEGLVNDIEGKRISVADEFSSIFNQTLLEYLFTSKEKGGKGLEGKNLDDAYKQLNLGLTTTSELYDVIGRFANCGVFGLYLKDDQSLQEGYKEPFELREKLLILDRVKASCGSVLAKQLCNELKKYLYLVNTVYQESNGVVSYRQTSVSQSKSGSRRVHPTLNKLQDLANGASELTELGRYLSINNGIKSLLFDQWSFLNNLETTIITRMKAKDQMNHREWVEGNRAKDEFKSSNNKKEDSKYTINLGKMFTDNAYAESVIKLFDNRVKHSFNILDIILGNENYKSFIKTAIYENAAFKANSAKFRAYDTLYKRAIDELGATKAKDKLSIFKRVEDLCSDIVFRKWLASKKFKVVVQDGDSYVSSFNKANEGRYISLVAKGGLTLDLETEDGLATFKYLMENKVFPQLQKLGHPFFSLMGWTTSDRNTVHLTVDAWTLQGIDMSPREDQSILNRYRLMFNELQVLVEDVIKSPNSNQIDVRELIWLYNQVVYFGKIGEQTLTSLFDTFETSNNLTKDFREFEQWFDANEDIIIDRDLTVDELCLWTAPMQDMWSSNLKYIFNASKADLHANFMAKLNRNKGSLDEMDYMDAEDAAGFSDYDSKATWNSRVRYATNSKIITYGPELNYYLRGHLPKNQIVEVFKSELLPLVRLGNFTFNFLVNVQNGILKNVELYFPKSNSSYINSMRLFLRGKDYGVFEKGVKEQLQAKGLIDSVNVDPEIVIRALKTAQAQKDFGIYSDFGLISDFTPYGIESFEDRFLQFIEYLKGLEDREITNILYASVNELAYAKQFSKELTDVLLDKQFLEKVKVNPNTDTNLAAYLNKVFLVMKDIIDKAINKYNADSDRTGYIINQTTRASILLSLAVNLGKPLERYYLSSMEGDVVDFDDVNSVIAFTRGISMAVKQKFEDIYSGKVLPFIAKNLIGNGNESLAKTKEVDLNKIAKMVEDIARREINNCK